MLSRFTLSSFLAFCLFAASFNASSEGDKNPAENAYHQIEGNVFDQNEIQQALRKLKQASIQDKDDPWVYLASSLAELVFGYQVGDWYTSETFSEGSVDRALAYAQQAVDLDPDIAHAHAHLARIQIIKGDYQLASESLNQAYQMNPENFYPWYFKGIIAEKYKDVERANRYFDEALKYTEFKYQTKITNSHKRKVLKIAGSYAELEAKLKQNISSNPADAYVYGSYATFLMNQDRYAEAVKYWKKALEKRSYPHAQSQLEKSMRLAAEQ